MTRPRAARSTTSRPGTSPTTPDFLSPQRVACDPDAPSQVIEPYASSPRALQLGAAGRPDASSSASSPASANRRATPRRIDDFLEALPGELVCDAPVVSVHEYLPDPGDPVERIGPLLDCDQRIWVTELGSRPAGRCEDEHATLVRYYNDPRVDVAFHYSLREDNLFRTGLVSTDLESELPALALWKAWGSRTDAAAPPPAPVLT